MLRSHHFSKGLVDCWRTLLKVNNGSISLSVQVCQDQQNNSVKHPGTVSLPCFFKLYVYFECSPSAFEK